MEPLPTGGGRASRLALVAVGLLVLLGVVAFASRNGFGGRSQAAPTPGYVSYAVTLFLIVFVLAIPFALYALRLQVREGQIVRRSFAVRVISNVATILIFGVAAFLVFDLKRHHPGIFHIGTSLGNPQNALPGQRSRKTVPYEPTFEWTVLWITLAVLAVGLGVFAYRWRARRRRLPMPLERQATVAEDFAASIDDAIDDLEGEPDPRRAVIAAYARMEGVLARHGLRRRPSETPLEYLRRILLGLTSRGDAATALTSLFEQAKFSRHEIDGTMKQDAIDALREIRDDLQRTGP